MNTKATDQKKSFFNRFLDGIEYAGNKLPDPAILFLLLLALVWILSLILSPFDFAEIDPRTGESLEVINLLTGSQLAAFLSSMINTFVT
ncbi:MAG TPA: aminobenzoyl-glutamate transporter, partial [Balneola sp.]|nr:aminobenzoyl-glutamate transporter [Balneola sp.]